MILVRAWALNCMQDNHSMEDCVNYILRMESIPSTTDLPSLRAVAVKSGDLVYTPPGMVLVEKSVHEHSVTLWHALRF